MAHAGALTDCDNKALPENTIVSEEDVLVCTVTINSRQEKDTFHKRVCSEKKGGKHYKFLELTDVGAPDSWFKDACDAAGKQKAKRSRGCEVLLVSGHFAGKYFFGESGKKLTTEELEDASCKKSCEGVLRDPTEVFLFGCNTLSGKTSKSDNAELMGRRLQEDGLSQADIEEIVQGRFGDLGDSNKESMRRAFSGVPNVYGYNDIGPLGATVSASFDAYLAQVEQGGRTYRDWLTERQLKPVTNIALMQALKAFPITTTCGVPQDGDSPDALSRKVMCALGDDSNPIAARLGLLQTVISDESDFMRYLPSMQKFFDNHSPPYADPKDQAAFEALKKSLDGVAGPIVARIEADRMKAYPILKYDMSTLAYTLGWGSRMKIKTQSDFEKQVAIDLLRKGPINTGAAKLVCTRILGYERNSVADPQPYFGWRDLGLKASDIDSSVYTNSDGLRLLGCLQPHDPEILDKLAKSFSIVDPLTHDAAIFRSFGLDMRFLSASAGAVAFKRLLSIKPQPVLEAKTLIELAHQLKSAQAEPRGKGFEVFKMIAPPPSDPAVLKEICAVPGAATALDFCAKK